MAVPPPRALPAEPIGSLLQRLRPSFQRIFSTYRVPAHETEDIAQFALLRFLSRSEEIRDPEAWLVGTVRNQCIIYWRKRLKRDELLAAEPPPLAAPAAGQLRVEARADLEKCLRDLAPSERRLLRLRYVLGLTTAATAARLGYGVNRTWRTQQRLLARLAMSLREGRRRPPSATGG